ncbi:MAG: LptF/LptG family permease [Planctomycetota bacterium]
MDRYVGSAVLGAYIATATSFFVVATLFEVLANGGKYARNARNVLGVEGWDLVAVLAEHEAYKIPVLFLTFAPYATVIACMFGVTRMSAANELVPMVFSGRSMFRILRPAVLVAVASGLSMACLWQWGGSLVNDRYLRLHALLDEGEELEESAKHVLVRAGVAGEQVLHCARYLPGERKMEGVTLYDRGVGGGPPAIVRAKQAQWDDGASAWSLTEGERRVGNRVLPLESLALKGMEPDVVRRLGRGADPDYVQMLSYTEIDELRGLRPGRHDLLMAYHLHFATPLSCVILVLLTLTLAVHFERGSKVGRVIVAIFVCAAFLVFDLACRNLGLRQFVHPVVAAWTPSIVFGAFGVLSYSGIRT